MSIYRNIFIMCIVYVALIFYSSINDVRADESSQIKEIGITQPPIDFDDLNRVWIRLKKEVGAPPHLKPPPIILDWNVPFYARMGFQYPNKKYPDTQLQISIAPRTVDMLPETLVSFGIGHELLHYLFLMRENDYNIDKAVFKDDQLHHCNQEFKQLQKIIADVLWSIYHSSTDRSIMYDEIVKSCGRFGNQ